MLTCLPQSLCNWNFHVRGTSLGLAELYFNFFTEQGDLRLGDTYYQIHKHGWASGHWTLESNGEIFADAQKSNPFYRSFEVIAAGQRLTVKAESPLTRCFEIMESGSLLGTIRPMHPFTRRAVIDCAMVVPELTQLFCFWLAVLTWRRAAKNNNA